jgi:L-arabinose isomerase
MGDELAKIGFLALAAKWFWDTKMSDSSFTEGAQSQISKIEASIAASNELISVGLVTTEESARSAAAKFREANLDALVACCVMWSEDQPLLSVLEELRDTPLLVWCWTPGTSLPKSLTALDLIEWSGPVGAQQVSGALRRSGRKFTFVLGNHNEKETIREIQEFLAAAAVARSLRHARIGLLPYRYDVMTNTWVDEFDLRSKIGIDVIYISVGQLASSAASVKDGEVKSYVDGLQGIRVSAQVSSKGLSEAARTSLGVAKIVKDQRLDALSIGDCNDELHAALKCRPCLYLPSVFEQGVVVGSEGDLLGILAQLILSRLSGQPTLFTEIFTYDEQQNQILVGHAGMHDIRLAESRSAVTITPDYEYPREEAGVWMAFSVKPGPVTLLSITSGQKGFHFVATKGEALPAEGRLQGYPSALVKLDLPLKSFFAATTAVGTTQHWALVPGDLRGRISKLAYILGIDYTVLNSA